METDIPLKALTVACARDLLSLFGSPGAEVIGVESLELPATSARVDSLLRLRSAGGTEYLHLVEWQGYRDPSFLRRALYYWAWLTLHQDLPVRLTLIYLKPGDDTGSTFRHVVDGEEFLSVPFRCVRLWQHDAAAALASGLIGLIVLSPLMAGATPAVVEEAATLVLRTEPDVARQAELLNILGIFAEPLIHAEGFIQMIGRERLMESRLMELLMQDKLAELDQQREAERAQLETARQAERALLQTEMARREALLQTELAQRDAEVAQLAMERQTELAQREAERHAERAHALRGMGQAVLLDAIAARFPAAPLALATIIRDLRDPDTLLRLHRVVLQAPDEASAEQAIREAATLV